MWHEAKANEKRIKELMVDHKRRAERRRAFYESRLGDPRQLLRVIGSSCKLYPDAEQYYYHENTDNLMPWQGNPEIKIDRFDGRSLLDYVPEAASKKPPVSKEELDMLDELNFERYHDLVEMERLKVYEEERLSEVESEWNKLLDRHKALLAMLNNNNKKSDKSQNFYAYDYGKSGGPNVDDLDNEQESQLLKEADILQYVDDLTDKDRKILNEMAEKYGIHNYGRLLRMAKKDRDDQLRDLKGKQNKDGNGSSSKSKDRGGSSSSGRRRSREDRRRHRRSRYRSDSPYSHRRGLHGDNRKYESSDSETSVEEPHNQSDVVIEFGSTASVEQEKPRDSERSKTTAPPVSHRTDTATTNDASKQSEPPKKLTPMEKLKLKMRAGLEKQIKSEEREKRWREREQELERIRGTYKYSERGREKSPGDTTGYTAKKPARRYYSPSSSSAGSRSPTPDRETSRRSPSSSLSPRDNEYRKRRRSSSDSRSKRRRKRSYSRSPERRSSRRRSRSRRRSSPDSRRKRDSSRSTKDSRRSRKH